MEKVMKEAMKKAVDTVIKDNPDVDQVELKKMVEDVFENGTPVYKSAGIDDEFMKFLYGIGYQAYKSGKYADALAAFDLLYTYDASEAKYILGKALCYKEMHKYPNAINEFTLLTVSDPEDPSPYWHLYECYDAIDEPWGAGAALGAIIYLCREPGVNDALKQRAEAALPRICEMTASIEEKKEE